MPQLPLDSHYITSGRRLIIQIGFLVGLGTILTLVAQFDRAWSGAWYLGGILLYSASTKSIFQWANLQRGLEAEESMVRLLKHLPQGYEVQRNVVIPGTKIGDIDVLVKGPQAYWVVEVKNWRGPVHCCEHKWWIQRANGSLRPVKSPTRQAERAAQALRKHLGKSAVVLSVVAFDRQTSLRLENSSVPVLKLQEVPQFILEYGNAAA